MNNDMEMPYFMYNKKWYYYDEDEEIYKLTEKAPVRAVRSYISFYSDDDIILEEEKSDKTIEEQNDSTSEEY